MLLALMVVLALLVAGVVTAENCDDPGRPTRHHQSCGHNWLEPPCP